MQETWDMGLVPESERFPGGGHGNPLQYSCLENPKDSGAWRATVHGVTKSQTQLKWLRTHACNSVGKESAYSAGDQGSTPGLGRSDGEGISYPLQYSWASLVAQLVKNLPAMWETWFWSLGWEDLLEKGKATHSSILTWRVPWIL